MNKSNRTIAESIAKERSGARLVETIEYYLNELDRLEKKELDRLESQQLKEGAI
jgi:ubiquinone biosynthesis protein UbiJ